MSNINKVSMKTLWGVKNDRKYIVQVFHNILLDKNGVVPA
jgi:hypothetical protein